MSLYCKILMLCTTMAICPQITQAGVVISSSLGTNTNAQGKIIGKTSNDTNGAGIVFTTGSSSSWDLNTIKLALTSGQSGSYQYSGGTVSFYLYRMATGANPKTANSLTFVGTTSVDLASYKGNAITKSFDLSGFDNLSAGTQYFLGMNATGYVGDQTLANDFLKISGTTSAPTAQNSSGWSIATNYSFMVADYPTAPNSPTGIHDFSSSTTSVAYQYAANVSGASVGFGFEIDAVAVPEPGTLVLFSFATIMGIVAFYLKRRNQKPATSPSIAGI